MTDSPPSTLARIATFALCVAPMCILVWAGTSDMPVRTGPITPNEIGWAMILVGAAALLWWLRSAVMKTLVIGAPTLIMLAISPKAALIIAFAIFIGWLVNDYDSRRCRCKD